MAPRSRLGAILGWILALGAAQLVAAAIVYWVRGIDTALDLGQRLFALNYPIVDGRVAIPLFEWDRQMFHAHAVALWGHIIASPLALALGPLQRWPRLRTARPRLHRALGVLYVTLQLVGLPCGMYLGRFDLGGAISSYGFFAMGATTLGCTLVAVRAVLGGDRAAHRAWMIRGYAVMWSSSVLFRLLIFWVIPRISDGPLPGGFRAPYVAFVFLSWALALLAADLYLHVTRRTPAPG